MRALDRFGVLDEHEDEEDEQLRARPAPGKVTRTAALPGRATSAGTAHIDDQPVRGLGYLATSGTTRPPTKIEHDDPFALHLIEQRAQSQLDQFTTALGGAAGGAVRVDEQTRLETDARRARGLARPGAVALHPDVDPDSTEGRTVLAHEAVHLVQFTLPMRGAPDIAGAEAEAAAIAAELVAGGRARRPQMPLPAMHIAADEDAAGGAGTDDAAAKPTYSLPANQDFEVRGNVMIYRRAWMEDRGGRSGLEPIPPTNESTKAPRRMKVVLDAFRAAGNFWWATPEMLADAAHQLVFDGPYDEAPEIADWRFTDAVFAVLGPPPDADLQWIQNGEDMLCMIRSTAIISNGKKRKGGYKLSAAFVDRLLTALSGAVSIPVPDFAAARSLVISKIDASTDFTASIWYLSRPYLEQIFGEEAWANFVEYGTGSTFTVGGMEVADAIPMEDLDVVYDFMNAIGADAYQDPGKRKEVLSPYVATVIRRINEHPLKDKIIARIRDGLVHDESKVAETITGNGLQRFIDDAELDQAYADVDIARPWTFDPDGTRAKQPMVDAPIRGDIINTSGRLVTAEEAHFRFRRSNDDDPFVIPRIQIQWVTKSMPTPPMDADGNYVLPPSSDGDIVHGPVTITGIENQEDAYKLRLKDAGWYRIHAFVHHNLFRSGHFEATVEVRTEAARNAELREEAFGDAGVDFTAGYTFDTGYLDDTVVGDASYYQGLVLGGDRPQAWDERTLEDRMAPLKGDQKKLERVIEVYKGKKDKSSKEILEYAEHALAEIKANIKELKQEQKDGWKSFELRGSYVSRKPGIPDATLKLVGMVSKNPQMGALSTWILIHDYSQVYEPKDYEFTGLGSNFENAFEAGFVNMTKTYPPGRVALLAESLDDELTPTDRTIGFELDTGSAWRDIKEVVWSPVVQTAVNFAGIALSVLVPITAPFVVAALAAYNGIDSLDNLAEMKAKGTATTWDEVTTIGQIALDLLPFLSRAKLFAKNAKTTMYVIDGVEIAGSVVMMTVEGLRMAEDLRDQDLREIAELQEKLDANPSDAALRKQIEVKIAQATRRTEEVFVQMGASGAMMMAKNVIFTHALAKVMQDGLADLEKTGVFFDDPDVKRPYYDAVHGRIVGNSKEMGALDIERMKRAHITELEARRKDVADTLGVDVDTVAVVPGDKLSAEKDADGNWTVTFPAGSTRADLVEHAWSKRLAVDPNAPKERPALARDAMRPVFDPALVAAGHNVPVGNRVDDHAEAIAIARKLSAGDPEGFAALGVQVPDDFDARAFEWGVGRLPNDDGYILVKGTKGHVDWGHFPGVIGVAHTHPAKNLLVDELTLKQLLRGSGDNKVDISRGRVLPSDADFAYCARHDVADHVVLTPFVYHDGKVVAATAKRSKPRLEFVIHSVEYVGDALHDGKHPPVFKARVTVRAGGKDIETVTMWSTYHSSRGDVVSIHPIEVKDRIDLDPRIAPPSASEAQRPRRQPDYTGQDADKAAAVEAWNAMIDDPSAGYQGDMTFEEFLAEYRAGYRFGHKHGDKSPKRRWYKEGSGEERAGFQDGISAEDAFAQLTAKGKSFGPYFKMLKKLGLATKGKIIAALEEIEPGGKLEDTVRGKLRERYRDKVLKKIADTPIKTLKKEHPDLFKDRSLGRDEQIAAARHREMMKATEGLDSADKGNLVEKWYERVHADDGAQMHVAVDADDMWNRHGIKPEELGKDRAIDILEANTAGEIKTVNHPLGTEQQQQFNAYAAIVDRDPPITIIDRNGDEVELHRLKYVFTTTEGAKQNVAFMRKAFQRLAPPKLFFEVFDARGVKHTIKKPGDLDVIESW